jgi:hypothetical protein
MRAWLLVVLSLPALAAPSFRPKNAQPVRVRLGDKREPGFGVKPVGGEWRLELGRKDVDAAELIDVQNGMKWQLSAGGSALVLDGRFIAGHAYRVELRHGPKTLASALVYLYPPEAPAQTTIQFGDGEPSSDNDMATLPKPTL